MKKKSNEDPILAELHETRRKIMEECGNDANQFHAMLKRLEVKYADRLVGRSTKPLRKPIKRANSK